MDNRIYSILEDIRKRKRDREKGIDSNGSSGIVRWDADIPDNEVIFRTAENGKVYALNSETGETSGLGDEIDQSSSTRRTPPHVPRLLGREENGDPQYSDDDWEMLRSGENDFSHTSFQPRKLADHKQRHGPNGDGMYTQEEADNMNQRARDLLSKPVGGDIDGFVRRNGMVVRFDKTRNEIAIGMPGKKIHSIHLLNDPVEIEEDGVMKRVSGYDYFLYQKRNQEKK